MQTTTEDSVILQKTRELCQILLTEPEFKSVRSRVDAFMADEKARAQFDALNEKGEFLHHKQHQGVQLSKAEVAEFEKERDAALANPLIKNFLEAQRQMHEIQETVGQYVGKTFELGRVPSADDFESGSCGHGCGCDHNH